MRLIVSLLLAIVCLPVLAASASPQLEYSMAIKVIGLDGKGRLLSVHASPRVFALSPDGSRYAYVVDEADGAWSRDLRVADVRGSGERLVVRAPSGIASAAWAPNGRTIALSVASRTPTQPVAGIYLVEPDGTGLRRVAEYDHARSLAWSPDSRLLAMDRRIDNRPPERISVLTLETGSTEDIAEGVRPQWSPDGKLLLFEKPAGQLIGVVPVTGGAVRPIFAGSRPSWSPDGRRIAFHRAAGRASVALWVVSSGGGRPRLLVKWAADSVWSPNGRLIAYVKWRFASICGDRFRSTLGFVRLRDGKARQLLVTRQTLTPLAWSRDSRRLLYTSLLCPGH